MRGAVKDVTKALSGTLTMKKYPWMLPRELGTFLEGSIF